MTPDLLLALLAIQIHGGKEVPDSTDSVKLLKKPIAEAVKQGLLSLVTRKEPHPTKKTRTGKSSMVTIKSVSLTAKGREELREIQDPLIRGVVQSTFVVSLREDLEKQFDGMKSDLSRFLQSGFEMIRGRLDEACENLVSITGGSDSHTQEQGEPSLSQAIAEAYRELCYRVEFEEGLISIPRLFHKTRQAVPNLEPAQFKEELSRLQGRGLDLRVINEVHQLSESELSMAIPQGETLLFYVYWPQERPE